MHEESTSKGLNPKEFTSKELYANAHDGYVIGDISQTKASSVGVSYETQRHTGKFCDSCQSIDSPSLQKSKKLTDETSSRPSLAQKQTGSYSFSQAPDLALNPVVEYSSTTAQSASCDSGNEFANQPQLPRAPGNLPSIYISDNVDMPSAHRYTQCTRPWRKKQPQDSDVAFLYRRKCIDRDRQHIDYSNVPPTNAHSLEYDRGSGQELTLRLGSIANGLSGSSSVSVSLKNVVNKTVDKSTGTMLALDKLQYGSDLTTDQGVSVPLVELETKLASGVNSRERSSAPKAGGVTSRLYGHTHKSRKTGASPEQNISIIAATRHKSTPKHSLAANQESSLATLHSSQPSLLSLRSLIAAAPMASPEVREIQKLIVAAMYGEIVLDRDYAFEAPLQAIHDKMMNNEGFRKAVVAFGISKLGYYINENKADLSIQDSDIGAEATDATTRTKINLKTCTYDELMAEHKATKVQRRNDQRRINHLSTKCNKLTQQAKSLTVERDHWRTISTSVPSTVAPNCSTKWQCSCGILNDSWVDMTEWTTGKIPKEWKMNADDAGIPESATFGWAQTEFCKFCGRHKLGPRPERTTELRSKRKLDSGDLDGVHKNNVATNVDQNKRYCQNGDIGQHASQDSVPVQSYDSQFAELVNAGFGTQLTQIPVGNHLVASMEQSQTNDQGFSGLYFSDTNGTITDQLDGDMFANFSDIFDENAGMFTMESCLQGTSSPNLDMNMTPDGSSPDPAAALIGSQTPIIIDYIPEIFEEIETILPISEADIEVGNIGNEQLEQPAAREIAESADYSQSAPQKVQSNVAHGIHSNYTNKPDLTISTHLKPKVH